MVPESGFTSHVTPTVMVVGHICLDLIPGIRSDFQAFLPGHLVEIGPAQFAAGGAVANTGIALHRLGIPVRLVGKVGADPFAERIHQILEHYITHAASGEGPRTDIRLVCDECTQTSYSIVLNPPQADRLLLHYPGANDTFRAYDVSTELYNGVELLHFGYPPLMKQMYEGDGRELVTLLTEAKRRGLVTSLDMAMPDPSRPSGCVDWVALLRRVLPYVDLFFPSVEEAMYMLERPRYEVIRSEGGRFARRVTAADLSAVADKALEMGAQVIAIKLGDQGLYVRTQPRLRAAVETPPPRWWTSAWEQGGWAGRELYAPCFQVEVVGTTGAGDCTIAGFLAALLRGMPLEQAITVAVAVGACNVERADAVSGVIPWDRVVERIASGWLQHQPAPTFQGWIAANGVFRGPRDASGLDVPAE